MGLCSATNPKETTGEVFAASKRAYENECACAGPGLPLILEYHLGEGIWDWFYPGTRDRFMASKRYHPQLGIVRRNGYGAYLGRRRRING